MAISNIYTDTGRIQLDSVTQVAALFNDKGVQTGTRALTAAEVALLAQDNVQAAAFANKATLTTRGLTALDANKTFLAIASPTNAQVSAQVRALTQQMNGVIRLVLNKMDATD